MSNSTSDKKNFYLIILVAVIGSGLGTLLMSKLYIYETTDGVQCENHGMGLTVTCPPSISKEEAKKLEAHQRFSEANL